MTFPTDRIKFHVTFVGHVDEENMTERNFEDVRDWNRLFQEATKDMPKKDAEKRLPEHKSCTHQPIYSGDGKILDRFGPNPVHLGIGQVKYLERSCGSNACNVRVSRDSL